jgi:hypothetical protein
VIAGYSACTSITIYTKEASQLVLITPLSGAVRLELVTVGAPRMPAVLLTISSSLDLLMSSTRYCTYAMKISSFLGQQILSKTVLQLSSIAYFPAQVKLYLNQSSKSDLKNIGSISTYLKISKPA